MCGFWTGFDLRTLIAIVLCLVWVALLIYSIFSRSAAAVLAIATPVMMTAVGFLFKDPPREQVA